MTGLLRPLGALVADGPPDSDPALGLTGGAGIKAASDEPLAFGRGSDPVVVEVTVEVGFGDGVDWLTAVEEVFGAADLSCPFVGSLIPESDAAFDGADGLGVEDSSLLPLTSGSLTGFPELAAFPVGDSASVEALGIAFAGGAGDDEAGPLWGLTPGFLADSKRADSVFTRALLVDHSAFPL